MDRVTSTTRLAVKLAEHVQAAQGSEIAIPTAVLADFLTEGEQQLKGLFDRIKVQDNQINLLQDRIATLQDSMVSLRQQVQSNTSGRK